MTVSLTSETWPIGAALLQFPGTTSDGTRYQDAGGREWLKVFTELALSGFEHVDLTEGWVRPGELPVDRQLELRQMWEKAGLLGATAISTARRSVIDPDAAAAAENLAYSHRAIDAAALLGIPVVSVGLFRALLPAQQRALWFWTAQGATDPVGDTVTWNLAVSRIRELGEHAAAAGVLVSLEQYEDTYLGTADSAVAFVEAVGHPSVGLNPDLGNLIRLHRPIENWEQMLLKTLPHANYWHVKNYFRDEDPVTGAYFAVPAPMSMGLVSYRRAIQIALEVGFNGPLCVEHYGGDGLTVAASNRDYLRKLIADRQAINAL